MKMVKDLNKNNDEKLMKNKILISNFYFRRYPCEPKEKNK